MNIGDLCRREVVTITADQSLADAVRAMHDRHVGAVVVVERIEGKRIPVGIVTDRDVVCGQLERERDLFCLTVADVMTPRPRVLAEGCEVSEGLRIMTARGVRRAPVVREDGDLIGIVSVDDLLPELARELGTLTELLGTGAHGQRRRNAGRCVT